MKAFQSKIITWVKYFGKPRFISPYCADQVWNDGFITFQNNQLLRCGAPPAVRVTEVGKKFRGCFTQQPGLRPGLHVFVNDSVDSSTTHKLVVPFLFNNLAQITSLTHPGAFLSDA